MGIGYTRVSRGDTYGSGRLAIGADAPGEGGDKSGEWGFGTQWGGEGRGERGGGKQSW